MTLSAILIPARWGSKPLCDLDGLPMIRRVHDICAASKIPTFVLTDDVRVANAVNDKCTVIIDKREFNNGTERCAGAIQTDFLKKFDTFINVQGDMPDVTGKMINGVEVSTIVGVYLHSMLKWKSTCNLMRTVLRWFITIQKHIGLVEV
jgi:CMP-2-keto-3-deoxyoctulosonic acid synthetase